MEISLQNDRDAFNAFIEKRLNKVSAGLSLEDALAEFRAYQQELRDVQAKVQEAKASSERGESQELEIAELINEVTEKLAAKGIHE
jgi:hypothetical protein